MSTVTASPDAKTLEMSRAVRVTKNFSIDELSIDTLPVSSPGPGQVLFAIKAVSLNYRDLLILDGKYASCLRSLKAIS